MSDETDHPKIKLVDTPWGKAPKFTGVAQRRACGRHDVGETHLAGTKAVT